MKTIIPPKLQKGDKIGIVSPSSSIQSRKKLFLKSAEKLEEARIRVRTEREKSLDDLDRKEKDGGLSEDDKFRLKNELQKLVDDTNRKLEGLTSKKEKEILE
ncbi:MAG: Ribosome-recycling factor [Candidatus Moranbacteria bacterium GW2011_GWF1_44_4]|nr:MAG: Ribosome-recycling factor [Candidatus Moranbacteria bacterium GW2011_GWF1_44_4]